MFREAYDAISQVFLRVFVSLIKGYRLLVSPWMGNCCRFYPTCSYYAQTAIQCHGVIKGGLLTTWRLLRCHPLHPGGIDPVPANSRKVELEKGSH